MEFYFLRVHLTHRVLATCAVFYFLSQILFLVNIQFPRGYNFDEFHYVPSAKQFLELKENQNWEHPPLGKLLMAVGIAMGEDRPFGWRLMSTFFGALTLVGMYLWALALFRDEKTALWVGLITLCNHLLYVQARIGMLDTFMFCFIVWALFAFTAVWDPDKEASAARPFLYFAGAMFGLATASKWFAIIPWVTVIALVILIKMLQAWRTSFGHSRHDDWYHPDLWRGIRAFDWVLALGVIPVLAYFLTFTPFFFISGWDHSLSGLIEMQKKMWDGQQRVVTAHPYMSQWMDWAVMRRPIWYAFDREGSASEWVRGVLLLGNPLIMWSGLLAIAACLWGWLMQRSRDAFIILVFYGALYLSWMVIPRKIAFYYYYYPAGMVLSLAIAYVFHHGEQGGMFLLKGKYRWARWTFFAVALGIFVHFFPVLAALRIPAESFRKWMWFSSWI